MSFYVNAVGARVKARTNGQRLEPPRQPDRDDPIEKRLAPIPQPFRDMLASMHNHEPQVGTDGAIHASDNVSGVTVDDGLYLYNLCLKVRPQRTLEIGFAEGFSTLYFLAAAKMNGGGSHVAIDPFENFWHGIGSQKVRQSDMSSHFRFIEAKSVSALPLLASENSQYDLIFIDGDHRYDSELADFVLADVLCPKGGYLLFHDIWMDSTKKLVSFIQRNRADYETEPTGVNIAAFRKVGEDQRQWHYFVDF
jgi:predicted O-methyltransferase YrrM